MRETHVDPAELRELFEEAVQLPSSERAGLLARVGDRNASLGLALERLLAADALQGSAFDTRRADADLALDTTSHERAIPPDTLLGPYQIVGIISTGGMGEVYKALDTRLGRTVAIKVLPLELTRNSTARQRLEREARAVAALSHPNICPLFDIGHQDGTDFLVMEYLAGETLAARLTRGNLPLEEALNYALQIVDALAAAHRAGIIHRDLKPGNIMLSGGAVRLLDFGLAKRRSPGRPDGLRGLPADALTDTGTILGTVQYMAPEQLEGREADERTDIFAFGVVLYEMLTGRRAFRGSSRAAVIADILHVNPPRPSSQQPAIPSEIDELVGACLVKDPTARYQSVVELQAWLSAARQRAHAPARSVDRIRAVVLIPFLLLVGVIASFSWYARGGRADSTKGEPPASRDSPVVPSAASSPLIAVLPFRNLSPQSPQAFFSAGITEEIRGRLSKIGELRLMSRAAVEKYGENEATRAVRELGVTHLVTGSVRFDRDRVRIAVELGDSKTGQTLWLEQYERELSDVFVVQSDIAIRVARALSVNLSSAERARVERRPTQSSEAYELYLRQNELAMGVRAQNLAGMQLLRKALALDPTFALAEARLAYRTLVLSYYDKPKYIDEAIALSQHALSLDPSLSRGHFAIASAYLTKGFFAQARLSFLRALELDPNDTMSMQNLSLLEVQGGRLDEGLYWASRAFQLSARNSNDYYHVSIPALYLRDDESTLRWLAEAQRRFPSDSWSHEQQAIVELMQDHTADALVRVRSVAKRSSIDTTTGALAEFAFAADAPDALPLTRSWSQTTPEGRGSMLPETPRLWYAFMLNKSGDADRAAHLVEDAEARARKALAEGNDSPYPLNDLAAVAAIKREPRAALEWLNRAYTAGYRDYGVLARDPIFASLKPDAEFGRLLERMRNDVAAMRERARQRGLTDLAALSASAH